MHDDDFQAARGRFDPRQLPEFAPAPDLWSRVVATRQRQLRVRRWQRGGFAATAAVVAALAVWMAPRPQAPMPPELAGQRESQVLEHEWQQLAHAGHPTASSLARVRVIDATLQAAYDRDASADELAPLWQRRNQVLRGLIAQLQDDNAGLPGVTRI